MIKRDRIKSKFNGLCAYTGKVLDDKWQCDHITPIFHMRIRLTDICRNDETNMIPCCGIINHYKRSKDLEEFREYMLTFHNRLNRLPKKTMVERTQKRKEYMMRIANLFDISYDKPFTGIFYFEQINPTQNS